MPLSIEVFREWEADMLRRGRAVLVNGVLRVPCPFTGCQHGGTDDAYLPLDCRTSLCYLSVTPRSRPYGFAWPCSEGHCSLGTGDKGHLHWDNPQSGMFATVSGRVPCACRCHYE